MRRLAAILTGLFVLLLGFPPLFGETIVVGPDEDCDFNKIGKAISKAEPGDTIEIRPGLYKEKLHMREGIILQGSGVEKTKVCYWESVFKAKNIDEGKVTGITFEQLKNKSNYVPVVIDNCGEGFIFFNNRVSQPYFDPDSLLPKSGWMKPEDRSAKGTSKHGEDVQIKYGHPGFIQNETSRGIYLKTKGDNTPVTKAQFVCPITHECLDNDSDKYPFELYTRIPWSLLERHYYSSTRNGRIDVNLGKLIKPKLREFFFASFDQVVLAEPMNDAGQYMVNEHSIIATPAISGADGNISGSNVEASITFIIHFASPVGDKSFDISGSGTGTASFDPYAQVVMFGNDMEASSSFAKAFKVAVEGAFDDFAKKLKDSQSLQDMIHQCAYQEVLRAENAQLVAAYVKRYPESTYTQELKLKSDEESYNLAKTENTVEAYRKFIEDNPDNHFIDEAKMKVEELSYESALQANNLEAFESFLSHYPGSRYGEDIRNRIAKINYAKEKKVFAEIEQSDDIKRYKAYLEEKPDSAFASVARKRIEELTLENDKREFQKVCEINTKEGYRNFIQSYPDNRYISEAKKKLRSLQVFGVTHCDSSATGKKHVELKGEPDFFSTTTSRLSCGLKIEILSKKEDWYLILTPEGKQGYLYYESVDK